MINLVEFLIKKNNKKYDSEFDLSYEDAKKYIDKPALFITNDVAYTIIVNGIPYAYDDEDEDSEAFEYAMDLTHQAHEYIDNPNVDTFNDLINVVKNINIEQHINKKYLTKISSYIKDSAKFKFITELK